MKFLARSLTAASLLLVLVGLLLPTSAAAQGPIRFSRVQVELWPEYDQPGMLVIYTASLASSVQLPAEITLRIPTAAGEPNAVAIQQMDGTLITAAHTREIRGEWAYITFTSALPGIWLEFYQEIPTNSTLRSYDYQWPADYGVDSLRISVQQPLGSYNMSTSPRLTSVNEDQNGLVYNAAEIGAVEAGESFNLSIQYEKPDNTLTAERLAVVPGGPIATAPATVDTISEYIPWGIGILGLGIILSGIYWYWKSGQQPQPEPKVQRRKMVDPELEYERSEAAVYCHNCGKRAGGNDRFCRSCGAKLRKS